MSKEDEPFFEESDYLQRDDDRPGPPDGWQSDSWFDFKNGEWCRSLYCGDVPDPGVALATVEGDGARR